MKLCSKRIRLLPFHGVPLFEGSSEGVPGEPTLPKNGLAAALPKNGLAAAG